MTAIRLMQFQKPDATQKLQILLFEDGSIHLISGEGVIVNAHKNGKLSDMIVSALKGCVSYWKRS